MSDLPTGIESKVCADIAARQQQGLAKYGVTLADAQHTDLELIRHAYQEALDLPIYLRGLLEARQGEQAMLDELERLRSRVQALETLASQYREVMRRLAVSKDKADAWYRSKEWCPFWRRLAADLPEENEQQAMMFR